PEGSVLACREGNGPRPATLGEALRGVYAGRLADLARLGGGAAGEADYPLGVNDGLFAAGRPALLALDATLRRWPRGPRWVDERPDVSWRNQFVFNLALAAGRCGVELDPIFNVQLNSQEVAWRQEGARLRASWNGRDVRVLHFNGLGRAKYPGRRGLFARG